MKRPSPLLWLTIILLFILPTAAGRLILDLASGLIIFIFCLPIILTGLGWIGWKIFKSNLKVCDTCGASFINNLDKCPMCKSPLNNTINLKNNIKDNPDSIPASSATVDIKVEE